MNNLKITEADMEAIRKAMLPFEELVQFCSCAPRALLDNRAFMVDLTMNMKAMQLPPVDRITLLNEALHLGLSQLAEVLVLSTPRDTIAICLTLSIPHEHHPTILSMYQQLQSATVDTNHFDELLESILQDYGI